MPLFKPSDSWRVLGASGVAVPVTGTTDETALATITIPAGAMGPNGVLRVAAMWSCTNSGNNKTLRARLGGIAGSAFMAPVALTTSATYAQQRIIHNRNNAASQVSLPAAFGSIIGASTVAVLTSAIDTAQAQDIVITGQLANTGETITLESYLVELAYGA